MLCNVIIKIRWCCLLICFLLLYISLMANDSVTYARLGSLAAGSLTLWQCNDHDAAAAAATDTLSPPSIRFGCIREFSEMCDM